MGLKNHQTAETDDGLASHPPSLSHRLTDTLPLLPYSRIASHVR
jgi:hypothetical protein